MQTRRQFAGLLAGVSAAQLIPGPLLAQGGAGTASPRRIDVHHHAMPPIWLKEARDRIAATNRNTVVITDWSVERSLDDMDRTGVAGAVLSVTNPGIWFGDVAAARKLARGCNEYLAQLSRDRPQRFGVFATLPLPDVDGSLAEIAYAFDVLKVDGIGLMTSYEDKWPGDRAFAPVFEELDRRKAVVYFHPTTSACCSARIPDVSPSVVEFPIDTTRAVVSLLFSGSLAKYAGIRWIFSHGGAAIPPLADRIRMIMESQKQLASRIPNGVLHELRRLYYDTAQAANPVTMAGLIEMVSARQIVFGTDYPFHRAASAANGLAGLKLAADDLARIDRENALALLPRWRV